MSSDRTGEFLTTIKLMQNKPQYMNNELRLRRSNADQPNVNPNLTQNYSRFMLGAKSIYKELYLTCQKLEHLNELTRKKTTMFDGEATNNQLNELVYIIKKNISSLNQQIEQLRVNQTSQSSGSKNIESHSKNVVLNLQQKLASISSDFKSTLEVRTQNIQQQKLRQQQFTNTTPYSTAPFNSSASFNSKAAPFSSTTASSQLTNRSVGNANSTHSTANSSNTIINFDETDQSSQFANQPSAGQQQQQQQMQALLFDNGNELIEERASTMQSIESTIVELGTIFNQLATMVQHQEEMITRIDTNVTDANLNVEAAHENLLRYFHSISNNRWLMVKVFGVLFFFFVVFVMFA